MPARDRPVDRGRADGRAVVAEIARELKVARLAHSLSQRDVASAARLSQPTYSRIERGAAANVGIVQLSALLAGVGLRLHVRAYPAGQPLRDAAHVALLGRLRPHLHSSLRWQTEVPLPLAGDLRAWDAVISGQGWSIGVEAETRPRDVQALERRIRLKMRDGEMPHVILLLAATRHNRELLRDHRDALDEMFPMRTARVLEILGAGANPGSSAIALL